MKATSYVHCARQVRKHRFVCVRCGKFGHCPDLAAHEGVLRDYRDAHHWFKVSGYQTELPIKMEEKKDGDDKQTEDDAQDE